MSEEDVCLCETLYPYKGTEGQANPLLFEAGEEINVLKKEANGWWQGQKDDKKGWFPAAYVKEKTETPPLPPPPPEVKAVEPLAPGWKEIHTQDGRTYYYNKKSKATTWIRPTAKTVEETNSIIKTNNHEKSNHTENTHTRGMSSSSSCGNSPPNSPKAVKKSTEMKPVFYVVNGVCLPDAKRAKEQELLHPGKYSYCDFFWRDKGEKHVYESGFSVLLAKAHKGKQISKEMAELFKAREAIELHYSKSLAALAAESFASAEEGTMGEAWKQVKTSLLQESKIHKDYAGKLRLEVEKPLAEFKDEGKKELKKAETAMNELRKQLTHKHQAVEREKIAATERQKDLEIKMQSPKKTEEEVIKAKRKSTKQREDYGQAISLYNNAKDKWFEEKVTATLTLEKNEVDRIEMIKRQLHKYVKLTQEVTSKTNKTCEALKKRVTETDPLKDRELWVKLNKTGTVRPVDIER